MYRCIERDTTDTYVYFDVYFDVYIAPHPDRAPNRDTVIHRDTRYSDTGRYSVSDVSPQLSGRPGAFAWR